MAIIPKTGAALLVATVLVAFGLSACSGRVSVLCGSDDLYRESRSVGPLQIPDDLSVPDETESLRIPDSAPVASNNTSIAVECLEATPALGDGSDEES